jgi:hypothetical protein
VQRLVALLVAIQGVETILVTDKQPDGSRVEAGSMGTNVGNTDEWEIARAMDERLGGSCVETGSKHRSHSQPRLPV